MTGSSTDRQSSALATLPGRSFAYSTSLSWLNSEQRVVALAREVAVVRRAFLIAVGLADRTVHVEDQLADGASLPDQVHPPAGQVHQHSEVVGMDQHVGLEARHLAGRSRLPVRGTSTHHVTHHGINAQSFGPPMAD